MLTQATDRVRHGGKTAPGRQPNHDDPGRPPSRYSRTRPSWLDPACALGASCACWPGPVILWWPSSSDRAGPVFSGVPPGSRWPTSLFADRLHTSLIPRPRKAPVTVLRHARPDKIQLAGIMGTSAAWPDVRRHVRRHGRAVRPGHPRTFVHVPPRRATAHVHALGGDRCTWTRHRRARCALTAFHATATDVFPPLPLPPHAAAPPSAVAARQRRHRARCAASASASTGAGRPRL